MRIDTLLIGFGNVGQSLASVILRDAEYLQETFDLEIRVVGAVEIDSRGEFHSAFSENGLDLRALISTKRQTGTISSYQGGGEHETSVALIRRSGARLMIEMTPTNLNDGEPGLTHVKSALNTGMSVVTSNKGPLLFSLKEFGKMSAERGVGFRYSAAVGGALPIIPTGYYSLAGCRVNSIEGILNGTSNFILTEMTKTGASMGDALAQAQETGIAETDPKLDVEGYDTAFKLLIAANSIMAADMKLSDVEVSGIQDVSQQMIQDTARRGKVLRLIGRAKKVDGGIDMKVGLEEVNSWHPFYSVNGIWKAVVFNTELLGEVVLLGGKSNPQLAAGAIVRDIINLVQDKQLTNKAT